MNTLHTIRTQRTAKKTKQISVKLDKETYITFQSICEREQRPEGQLARLAIIKFINAYQPSA